MSNYLCYVPFELQMDSCVRCLRDGGADGAASVVLLLDEVEGCAGGDAVLEQLLQDTAEAISEGRSRAQLLHAVAIDKSPSELRALGANSVTDCFTDPCGWLQQSATSSSADNNQPPSSQTAASEAATGFISTQQLLRSSSVSGVQWQDLQLLRQLLQPGGVPGLSSSCCLVLAGLSTLLLRHSEMEVLQLLHQLKASAHICSILLPVHQDLHSPQVLSALQSLSTASLQLQSVPGLQQQLISQATGQNCHGQLTFSSRRAKLGRLRVDQQLYRLIPAGGVEVFAAPQGVVLDALTLVQSALGQQQQQQLQQLQEKRAGKQTQQQQELAGAVVAAAGGAGGDAADGQLAKKLSTSMRLEISQQERAAKAAVQLPYVHQGAGRAYSSGDARQYLPPAAGGYGPGVEGPGKLGHILYVRDSEEEHDSDEDPDDDLDV